MNSHGDGTHGQFDQKGKGAGDDVVRQAALEQAKLWRDRAIKHCLR